MAAAPFFCPVAKIPAPLPSRKRAMQHPEAVLFAGEKPFPILPAVDHYAGSEKLMKKAMAIQAEMGPVFDITCDCEDGAKAGAEMEHATMSAQLIMSADNVHGRVGARIHDILHQIGRASCRERV